MIIVEGSFEVELPTRWTDEAAEVGRGKKKSDEKEAEENESVERRLRSF